MKQFPFGGTRQGEFRVDIFNLTNQIHYNNPNTSYGSSTFGEINGGYGERQMRFALRFVFLRRPRRVRHGARRRPRPDLDIPWPT